MKKLIVDINTILQENLILSPKETVLCAVSSGQDSILLFLMFLHLKRQWKLHLGLIYCHHFWQRTNFFSFWQVWKVAFIFKVPSFFILTETPLSTENQARNWRQKSLERLSLLQNCNQIAFGHTASDKIETALWHLIRGSSPSGLNCIQAKILSKRTFVHLFFPIFETKSFKLVKKSVKQKKQFFCSQNSQILFYPNSKNLQLFFTNRKLSSKKNLIVSPFVFFRVVKQKFLTKKFLSLWPVEKKYFQLFQKNHPVFFKPSAYSLTSSVTELKIHEENDLIWKQKVSLKKEKIFLISSHSENLLFFSFFFKTNSVDPIFKKLRPLINLHREDILKFTKYYFLPVIPDPTNAFSKLSRNKIRNQLIPTIRYLFYSNFDLSVLQFLKILEKEDAQSQESVRRVHQILLETVLLSNCSFKQQGAKNLFSLKSKSELLELKKKKKRIRRTTQNYSPTKVETNKSNLHRELNLSVSIRTIFQKFPISVQSNIIKKIFFNYTSIQLNYSQIETLRFLILSKKFERDE